MSFIKSVNDGGRRSFGLLLFSGFFLLYAMRVNLSVAIVAMVGNTKKINVKSLSQDTSDYCPIDAKTMEIQDAGFSKGEFDWDEQTQGTILGAFFWGSMMTNFAGGLLADRYGGRVVYGLGILLTSILTLITPLAARHSTTAFIFIRVLEGMTEGVTIPAATELMSRWVPQASRSSFLSRVLSGCILGTVVTMFATGGLCESWAGWPSVFVLIGSAGIVWSVLWFVSDITPHGVPIIDINKQKAAVPFRRILTSPAFLVVVFTHVMSNWGSYCLLTEMSSYLAHVLHFDLHTNGLISSLPYLVKWVLMICYSAWLDRSIARRNISLKTARKLSTFIGLVLPAVLLASVQLAGCERGWVVLLLCLSVAFTGTDASGFLCSYQELSPNFAGILIGLGNTIATVPGFLAPQLTGYLTQDPQSLSSWRDVFLLTSLLYVLGGVVYLCFMSDRVQPWNDPNNDNFRKKDQDRAFLLGGDVVQS